MLGAVKALLPAFAHAGDWTATVVRDPRFATVESWTGGAVTGTSWALYNGLTWAPLGTLRETGPRLRATVSAADYSYPGIRPDGAGFVATRYHAEVLSGSILAGYQWTTGPLTTKAFAGAAVADKRTPLDPSVKDRGRETGAAVALEMWLDLGRAYLQLDTSWTALDETLNGRARAGWLVTEAVSVGIEASGGRDTTARLSPHLTYSGAGPFARLTWDRGEASVSGGLSDDRTDAPTWYATAQVLTRY
jgi:hypothetical protein